MRSESLRVHADGVWLDGDLSVPEPARGLVVFAHGSGSSRHSPRNVEVARTLQEAGLGTLLFDLLTAEEDVEDSRTARLRFDIALLARRLGGAVDWMRREYGGIYPPVGNPVGLFGASTGAAAALVAAATQPESIAAVVSRGGRPDLAAESLPGVRAPTLLVVGGRDVEVMSCNEQASARLDVEHEIAVVPRAGHLFAEPGALQTVSRLARDWFTRHLNSE